MRDKRSSMHVSPEVRGLLHEAEQLLPGLVALRRDLHRHPEVGLDLPRTQAAVLDALDGMGMEISTGTATTSVTAVLRGGKPGPVVLLRGDMDALPLTEQADVDYASAVAGTMHACGHDMHTAGLVGAARLLSARRADLPGTVVLMFQPGEEGCDGAGIMLEEGVLDVAGARPSAAFAVHVGPADPGTFATRPGVVLAGEATVRITVRGRGGHASQPHSAVDPVPPAAEIIGALQAMVTRRFPASDPVVLTITRVRAGEAYNIIGDAAELTGTARMVTAEAAQALPGLVRTLAEGIAAAHGCTAEADVTIGYPVTVNDPAETAAAIEDLRDLAGPGAVFELPAPAMASEDFSRILERVPGTFVFLGARPADVPPGLPGASNHSPGVVFDDSVLAVQSAALALLAIRALGRHR